MSRAYRCRDDAWLFISLNAAEQWTSLQRILALPSTFDWATAAGEPNDGKLAAALEAVFTGQDRAAVLAMLAEAHVPAVPVLHFGDLFDDPQVRANELIAELQHPNWGKVWQTGSLMKFSARQARIEHTAPLLGQHTDEVLKEFLGYDAEKISTLRVRNIVR
ncbi:MAG: CoA transferase [Candidatus Binataceae bacterium]